MKCAVHCTGESAATGCGALGMTACSGLSRHPHRETVRGWQQTVLAGWNRHHVTKPTAAGRHSCQVISDDLACIVYCSGHASAVRRG